MQEIGDTMVSRATPANREGETGQASSGTGGGGAGGGEGLDWMIDTYAHTPAAVRGHILSTGSSDREHLLQALQGQTGPYQVTPHHMHVTTHYSYCMRFNFRGD